MIALTTVLAPLLLASLPGDAFNASATLVADKLEVGQKYYIALDIKLSDKALTSKAGIPSPILQIQVPPSVELTGKVLSTYKELASNEFLQQPFERMVKPRKNKIRFKLIKQPAANERIFLNLVAYVNPDRKDDENYFIRRRLSIALTPGAVAEVVSPDVSDWSVEGSLQIGDEAALFELPKADGSKVALKDYLGKKNVVVTTYRAFW